MGVRHTSAFQFLMLNIYTRNNSAILRTQQPLHTYVQLNPVRKNVKNCLVLCQGRKTVAGVIVHYIKQAACFVIPHTQLLYKYVLLYQLPTFPVVLNCTGFCGSTGGAVRGPQFRGLDTQDFQYKYRATQMESYARKECVHRNRGDGVYCCTTSTPGIYNSCPRPFFTDCGFKKVPPEILCMFFLRHTRLKINRNDTGDFKNLSPGFGITPNPVITFGGARGEGT